jgi:hypothetical protein
MAAPPNRRPGRPLSTRCNARYEDDDLDLSPPRSTLEHSTNAGMYGFIISLISLGLLIVVTILWIIMNQENRQQQNDDRTRWMLYWFMFLDLMSFGAALTATILGGRGLTPSNQLYRGLSLAALIIGILEMAATSLFGLGLFCCVSFLELVRNVGG